MFQRPKPKLDPRLRRAERELIRARQHLRAAGDALKAFNPADPEGANAISNIFEFVDILDGWHGMFRTHDWQPWPDNVVSMYWRRRTQ